jgi:hypothetical protein
LAIQDKSEGSPLDTALKLHSSQDPTSLLLRIMKVSGSNFGSENDYREVSSLVPQSLQTKAEMLHLNVPRIVYFTSFSVILQFDAT